MRHETVSVTTQAEWYAAVASAAAIDVLPGPHQLSLDLRGRNPSPRIHVAGGARVTTVGPITLSCAGRIVVNDNATVELIPHGRAHVTGGTVHARAGTVVNATGGVIDCESGCTVFTPQRGRQPLRITMAPGVMWWDRDGAARLTKSLHTTEVTEREIHYHPNTPEESRIVTGPSAVETALKVADEAATSPAIPNGTTVTFATGDILVAGVDRNG